MSEYLEKAFNSVQPVCAVFLSAVMYILFPEDAYIKAFCAVLGAMILDVLTKYRAIGRNNGGYWTAIKTGKLNSHDMWMGTSRKIYDYLVIFILAGLSYRVSPVSSAAVLLSTVVYTVMFLREGQSIVENLNEAGGNWGWLLLIIKRRKTKIFEEEGITEDENIEKVNDGGNKRL